jgi:hypothetical protein
MRQASLLLIAVIGAHTKPKDERTQCQQQAVMLNNPAARLRRKNWIDSHKRPYSNSQQLTTTSYSQTNNNNPSVISVVNNKNNGEEVTVPADNASQEALITRKR